MIDLPRMPRPALALRTPETPGARATVWPAQPRMRVVQTALGIEFDAPCGWHTAARGGKLMLVSDRQDLRFAPIQLFTAHTAERTLPLLARRMGNVLRAAGAQVLGSTILDRPRPALLLDYETSLAQGERIRCLNVCELLDNGKLCLCMTFSDRAGAPAGVLHEALGLWRGVRINSQALPAGRRRVVDEQLRYQCVFPEKWLIDCADGQLTQLRLPGRARHSPTLAIECDSAPQRARSIDAQLADALGRGGYDEITPQPVAVGCAGAQRDGLVLRYRHAPRPAGADWVWEVFLDPLEQATLRLRFVWPEHDLAQGKAVFETLLREWRWL